MKINNNQVKLFGETILQIPLKGKSNRLRVRLVHLLNTHLENVINKETNLLFEEYAIRDNDGNKLFHDIEQTQPQIKEEFYLEIDELMSEYLHIEMNENNKDMLLNICNVLLDDKCPIELSGELALFYDQWCEECESVIEFYNKQNESE